MKRIGLTLAVAAGLFLFFAVIEAHATPIQPDLRKLISEPQQDWTAQFMPARAGWEGPEMAQNPQRSNPTLEMYSAAASAHARRAALLEAAIPDPRAVLGIIAVIFLLRLLRRREEERRLPQMENSQTRLAA